MPVSEARIQANRQNSLKSTGPKTAEGKERSRQNGLKHGLTGQGVVIVAEDQAEVDRRNETLLSEMAPRTAIGAILVRQLATLSVRMERGARQEFAHVAERIRHAAEEFDVERVETVEYLIQTIADDPRATVRLLKRRPEGIALMVEGWQRLRSSLTHEIRPCWPAANLEKAAHLSGLTVVEVRGSRLEALSEAAQGNPCHLTKTDALGLEGDARRGWARARLVEWIDREIGALEAHGRTLDTRAIEQDRAEAGDRALFDPSREANLARRYEAEARRGFFRALRELRQAEAAAPSVELPETDCPTPETVEVCEPLASSRQSVHRRQERIAASPHHPFVPGLESTGGRVATYANRQVALS